MLIREATDADVSAIARLLLEADDTRVISAESVLHRRRTRPERGRMVDMVAETDGVVVASGAAGLNISTTTEGAAWAFVTVDSQLRRQGIGDALGTRLVEHLGEIGATKATSFFRSTEEGERWATARGWSSKRAAIAAGEASTWEKLPRRMGSEASSVAWWRRATKASCSGARECVCAWTLPADEGRATSPLARPAPARETPAPR